MGKLNRVIFLFSTKFNRRDYYRFGFDIIQKNGYKVEAWDFTKWLHLTYSVKYNVPDPGYFSFCKVFETLEATKAAISELTIKDIVIDPWDITQHYDLGNTNGCKFGSFYLGAIPLPFNKSQRFIRQVFAAISQPLKTFKKIKGRIKYKIISKLQANVSINPRGKPSYDFMIFGGAESIKQMQSNITDSTTILKVHALDYDLYLRNEMNMGVKPLKPTDSYAVYLDQDVCFHPDFSILNWDPFCIPEKYYPEINEFFTRFTAATGLQVVIAAHPRADYTARGNPFEGRVIFTGETISLVKQAKLVFSHTSTSVNYAVLYHRPVVSLDSEHYKPDFRSEIRQFHKYLGSNMVNISQDPFVSLDNIKVDKIKYNRYKEQFIKEPGTPEKFVWNVFCDYLSDINK